MKTKAYSYGTPSWFDLPEEVIEQIQLGREMWDDLVGIEKQHRNDIDEIWRSVPEVATAIGGYAEAAKAVEDLENQIAEARTSRRSTKPTPADAEALKVARREQKDASGRLQEAKDSAHTTLKDQFDALRDQCRACRSRITSRPDSLYREYGEKGLSWASRNDIIDRYRRAGRNASRSKHPYGSGTLTVQQQKGSAAVYWWLPHRPASEWPNTTRSDGTPRRKIEDSPGKQTLRIQIGRARGFTPILVDIPVKTHRPIPDDATVKEVKVKRFRLGHKFKIKVSLVVEYPDPDDRTDDRRAVALRLGWSSDDGTLRVGQATASGPELPSPPADINHLVHRDGDALLIHADPAWIGAAKRVADVRSIRSQMIDDLKPHVVEALRDDPDLADAMSVVAGDVSRWRRFARFDMLARRWPDDHPLKTGLMKWRSRDRHLWEFEANEIDQTAARRRDAWRKIADWLCDPDTSSVVIHGLDFAELAKKPDASEGETWAATAEVASTSRRNARTAAPGELRAAVMTAAEQRGIRTSTATEGEST